MAEYSTRSPYSRTPQDNFSLRHYVPRQIIVSDDDSYIEIDKAYEHRPDLLSYDLYGTTAYWWVFAVRNMNVIKDPIYDLKSGVEIYVPSLSSIEGL